MKHSNIERAAPPRRLPPRWMVSPHYWREIELREQQAAYQVTRSVDEAASALSDAEARAIFSKGTMYVCNAGEIDYKKAS